MQTLTKAEQKTCSTIEDIFNIISKKKKKKKIGPQHNGTILSLQY